MYIRINNIYIYIMAYSHYKYALNNTQVKDGGPVVAWIFENASYIVVEEKNASAFSAEFT